MMLAHVGGDHDRGCRSAAAAARRPCASSTQSPSVRTHVPSRCSHAPRATACRRARAPSDRRSSRTCRPSSPTGRGSSTKPARAASCFSSRGGGGASAGMSPGGGTATGGGARGGAARPPSHLRLSVQCPPCVLPAATRPLLAGALALPVARRPGPLAALPVPLAAVPTRSRLAASNFSSCGGGGASVGSTLTVTGACGGGPGCR